MGPLDTSHLSKEKRELLDQLISVKRQEAERNPLTNFHSCAKPCGGLWFDENWEIHQCVARLKQHEFMRALEKLVAAFAGNRFGKTTALVVWCVIQHTPLEMLPDRLKPIKRATSKVVQGRFLLPGMKGIETLLLPEFKRWTPPSLLRQGKWEKAWKDQHKLIYFADGGLLEFYTYDQDASVMVGTSRDYVVYDEPPPESHYRECLIRTTDRGGCHRFGMTPVNMKGGGIGWIKRELFDKSRPDHPEHNPQIKVVRASIHDNPSLSKDEIEFTLSQYPEDERQAREHGDFIHFGGMIYPGGFERVLREPPSPDELKYMDIVVGIDPGLKNAAFVWGAFDNDNRVIVFDERLVQEGTALDYAKAIRETNEKWGLRDVLYVIDPSARNRSLVNAQSIEAELALQGIFCIHGQNQVQAGVQQVRRRMAEEGLFVSSECQGLRSEADEYRMEDRPDGEFKVVKENDHRLDALRYLCMARPWYPLPGEAAERYRWTPGEAPPLELLTARPEEAHLI